MRHDFIHRLAVGQNGHWRATDTTFNEQKDANGNVITWKAETFNMVWVYDTSTIKKLDTENSEINRDKRVANQYSVMVKYTGKNGYEDSGSDWWPVYYYIGADKLDTYVPWAYPKDTVQAWYWDETLGENVPEPTTLLNPSPTRTERYVGGDAVATFARGAGDSDGRWMQ